MTRYTAPILICLKMLELRGAVYLRPEGAKLQGTVSIKKIAFSQERELLRLCSQSGKSYLERVSLIFLIFLVLSSLAYGEQKTRIGVSVPLTGGGATYGVDTRNTLIFANETLGKGEYELLFEDDRCEGKNAATIAHKFVNVHKVRYVLGLPCSSTVLVSAPIYERAKVLVISAGASAPAVSQAGDYIFRTWPSDTGAAGKLVEFIASRHRRIGVIYEQTDYTQGFLDAFHAGVQERRIDVFGESFAPGVTDVRSLLTKIKGMNIEGLFINTQADTSFINVFTQIKELKLNLPLYAVYWPSSPVFLTPAGKTADDMIYVDIPSADELVTDEGLRLLQAFEAKFGKIQSINTVFLGAFESFRALDRALKSGKDPKEYLYSTKFQGLFGEWSFDKNGDLQGLTFVLKRIRDGKPERMETVHSS